MNSMWCGSFGRRSISQCLLAGEHGIDVSTIIQDADLVRVFRAELSGRGRGPFGRENALLARARVAISCLRPAHQLRSDMLK